MAAGECSRECTARTTDASGELGSGGECTSCTAAGRGPEPGGECTSCTAAGRGLELGGERTSCTATGHRQGKFPGGAASAKESAEKSSTFGNAHGSSGTAAASR